MLCRSILVKRNTFCFFNVNKLYYVDVCFKTHKKERNFLSQNNVFIGKHAPKMPRNIVGPSKRRTFNVLVKQLVSSNPEPLYKPNK